MDPFKNERNRNVDEWLESKISEYGKVEPRAGLDGRILANLEAERHRIAARSRWWWTIGTAAAMASIAMLLWAGHSSQGRNTRSIARSSTASSTASSSTRHSENSHKSIQTPPQVGPPVGEAPLREAAMSGSARRPIRDLARAVAPKLEQFPSSQPLSEQEQMLMSYVEEYPERAAFIAQARAEALQRDREEEAAAAAQGNAD
jgi:hypothetical protein